MLNECTVIISKCRHRNICALESYDSMDSNVKCKVGIFAMKHNDKKFIYSKKFQEQAFFLCDGRSMRSIAWIHFTGVQEILPHLVHKWNSPPPPFLKEEFEFRNFPRKEAGSEFSHKKGGVGKKVGLF